MGRRAIRVILVALLLGTALVGLHAPGAVAEEAPQRADVFEDLQLNGFSSSGTIQYLPPVSNPDKRGRDRRVPQIVVGDDSRIQVTDTTVFPYSAIAQLVAFDMNLPEDIVGTCTGSFVGPNVLLTAAHCVWDSVDYGGFADELLVIPGANGEASPFGEYSATALWIPDEYQNNSDAGSPFDYALVTIGDTSVEEVTGSFELGILTTAELEGSDFQPTTSGYPGDRDFATQWISSESSFTVVDGDFLEHSIDSFQGQSGSAVWRDSDLAVVGVESFETDTDNYAVRLDVPIMYELMGACQELGCKLNHFLTDIPGDGAAFDRVWERTDLPVASGADPRTWMWGPNPISKVRFEPYAEAPNGFRTVLYQEKSRMEITDPNSDPNSIWYVTNGLATVELMTGNLQLGNSTFEQHAPAEINVAGDGNDPNGPTYVTLAGLRDAPPHGPTLASGSSLAGAETVITATVDRARNIGDDPSLATHGVTAQQWVPETGHYVASVFWEFMNSTGTVAEAGQFVQAPLFDNPYFATGFPVTEAYWATVRVGGNERTVLIQGFERRVLTFTPGNPVGFEVEAGNVGIHYLDWYEGVTAPDSTDPGGEPPPPDNPAPTIGDLIASADFSSWPEVETTFGDTGAPFEDGYRVRNPPNGFLQLLADGTLGDGYFSLETRAAQPSAVGGASCIIYRADPNDENPLFLDNGYWFCFFYEGPNIIAVVTLYETAVDIIELGGSEASEPLPSASDWHQIGVIAQGSEFWFVVDGDVIGSLVHDVGPGSGQVGILSFNFDESEEGPNAVYDFRNLEIYSIDGASTPDPPPPPANDPPAEGEILYQSSLGDLPAANGPNGATGAPNSAANGYVTTGPADSGVYAYDDVSFGDASYAVDISSPDGSGESSGCLVVRSTAAGAYHLCTAYTGGTTFGTLQFYLNFTTPTGSIIDLGSYEFPSPPPANQPVTVKVITEGPDFWFYANGQLVGSAGNGSGTAGDVGIAMVCIQTSTSCTVEFSNLVVRGLAN